MSSLLLHNGWSNITEKTKQFLCLNTSLTLTDETDLLMCDNLKQHFTGFYRWRLVSLSRKYSSGSENSFIMPSKALKKDHDYVIKGI